MSNIYVNVIGNGSAWVDNPSPSNGDIITLFAYEDSGAYLIDITARDENGYAVALATTNVQQFQYDSSWGNLTITVKFSHDIITVNSNGNGYAYVNIPNPNNGEDVTLYSVPDRKYEVFEIICSDSNGYVLWTTQSEQYTFTYDSSWGDITIDVYFELKWIFKNLWILKQREWWRKNTY